MNEHIRRMAVDANPSSKEIYYVEESWPYNSAAWSGEDLGKFAQLIVKDCLDELETDYRSKHCAYTTHDLGIVQCTLDKIKLILSEKYNLK